MQNTTVWLNSLQGVFEHVIEFTQGSLVATAVAVVWGTEHSDDVLVMAPVETLHNTTAFQIYAYYTAVWRFKDTVTHSEHGKEQ